MTDEIVPGALFKRYKAQSDATSSTPSTGNDQTTSEIPQASTSAAVTVRDSETVASVSASTNVRPSTNTTASTNVTALATAATSTGATASTNVQPAVRRGGGGPLLINQKRQKVTYGVLLNTCAMCAGKSNDKSHPQCALRVCRHFARF
jgi:hypothetical protein